MLHVAPRILFVSRNSKQLLQQLQLDDMTPIDLKSCFEHESLVVTILKDRYPQLSSRWKRAKCLLHVTAKWCRTTHKYYASDPQQLSRFDELSRKTLFRRSVRAIGSTPKLTAALALGRSSKWRTAFPAHGTKFEPKVPSSTSPAHPLEVGGHLRVELGSVGKEGESTSQARLLESAALVSLATSTVENCKMSILAFEQF